VAAEGPAELLAVKRYSIDLQIWRQSWIASSRSSAGTPQISHLSVKVAVAVILVRGRPC